MTDEITYIDKLPVEYNILQNIVSNQFGLVVSKFKQAHYDGYIGQSQYNETVNIFTARSVYYTFSFENIITIENNQVVTRLNSPVIQLILDDVNKTLHITEALRFSHDGIIHIPVLPNVKSWLVFKYNNKLEFMTIEIHFAVIREEGCDAPYELTTKNVFIQNAYEPSGFKKIYSMTGELIKDDLAGYHSKLLAIWGIPEDSTDIDYHRLGVLSDMITI
jgi:hypothetical protein